ncbi:MAG: hypothetical protein AAF997_16375 [Myxococcota bacterium]
MNRVWKTALIGLLLLAGAVAPEGVAASTEGLVQIPASWFGAEIPSFEASCKAKDGKVVHEGKTTICETRAFRLLARTAKPGSSRIVSAALAANKDGVLEHEALAGTPAKYGKPTWIGHLEEFGPSYKWDLGGKRVEFYMGRANKTFSIVVLEKDH